MIEEALTLAAEGLPVFPVGADKKPRTSSGFKDATAVDHVLRSLYGGGPDWEGIGVAIPDGLVVIDVDPRNGGNDTLKALEEAGRALPRTRTTRTQSGGFHYWLTVPPDVKLRSTLGPGIDVKRAGKGYVVVPPTAGYSWLPGHDEIEAAPEWLLDDLHVEEKEGQVDEPHEPKFMERFEKGTSYGLRALDAELGKLAKAGEGGRNNALNEAAFSMARLSAGGELDELHAKEELALVAALIGLDSGEIRRTIDNGWRAGEQEPRQAPERDVHSEPVIHGRCEEAPSGEEGGELDESIWVDWEIDAPELPFYLHPFLPKNAYVLVFGATEASKSMAWHAIAAEGSTRGYKATVYSLENGEHVDRDRLKRLRPDPQHFRLTNEPLDLNDSWQLGALVKSEKEWGTDILVIDTYSHAFNSRSEDGNIKAIEFARRVRYIMHEVGCSVVLLDHTGYERKDEPRDASAKRQQVDVAIYMEKVGEWKPGLTVPRFRMLNKKAARFANPFDFTGEIRDVEVDGERGLELGWLHDKRPEWQ